MQHHHNTSPTRAEEVQKFLACFPLESS